MSAELDALEAEVTRNRTVDGSAKALIDGFKARLEAAGVDPVKLNALKEDLRTSSDDLVAAVTANTSAANP